MSKSTKNILIIIAIVLLLFGIILIVYNQFKTKPIDTNTVNANILDDANTGLENLINDILDERSDEQKNEANTEKNEATNTNTQETSTLKNEQTPSSDKTIENQVTPGEKKAIELVKEEWKKEWGNLNDVSFNNVMIQGDGKYVVSVNDSKTTLVIRRYIVDTATGLVEEK